MPTNQLTELNVLKTNDLPDAWQVVLQHKDVAHALVGVEQEIGQRLAQGRTIFPQDPWRALRLTPLSSVKVVILGQDPYHGPEQAHGLAFSTHESCRTPPSLRNIFKELNRSWDATLTNPRSNDLSHWAKQGVLLLNTVLTVEQGAPASHARIGWQTVTDHLITAVAAKATPVAFLLWGKHAQDKRQLIERAVQNQARLADKKVAHLVLEANHPSPLSANRPPIPFMGCNHFNLCNQWLAEQGLTPIQW